jgi:hypothetical protein
MDAAHDRIVVASYRFVHDLLPDADELHALATVAGAKMQE